MEITIRGVRGLADDVWGAELDPDELTMFGSTTERYGSVSIVLVKGHVDFDSTSAVIRFDHRQARVLNRGDAERVIVVQSLITGTPVESHSFADDGDRRFISDLPSHLEQMGAQLLARVRASSPGGLSYKENSKKYVETPDNFWTVKIQPRDRSLRVTVRGRPASFHDQNGLQLADDMAGYSNFKLIALSQVQSAADLILQARR